MLALMLLAMACSEDGGGSDGDLADGDADGLEVEFDGVENAENADSVETAENEIDGDADTAEIENEVEAEEEAYPAALHIKHYFPPTTPVDGELNEQFVAEGGTPPYSDWRVTLGDLPAGTTLNSDSGAWSGSPTTEGIAWFVVTVKDSEGSEASEMFGIRIGDPDTDGPLKSLAKGYQDVYEARHMWHGLSYSARTPDDPNGDYQLSCMGDAVFTSGQCTSAMAFRYGATHSEEALDVLRQHVEGWRFFQELTGVKGLIGRSYLRADDPVEDGQWDTLYPDADKYCYTEGEYAGWCWQADTSRDQVTGAVLGVSTAYDMIDDPELKQKAADFLIDLADHVIDHDMQLVDPDGECTQYGNIDGNNFEGWPAENGLNAVCLLAWIKAAEHASGGEQRFKDYINDLLVNQEYARIMRERMWVYNMLGAYQNKWYNAYMAFENFFILTRLEEDPELHSEYSEIFRDTLWLNLEDETPNRRGIKEHNPVKTPWYLYSTGEKDPDALYHALWQLTVFSPPPLRNRYIQNSIDPEVEINPDRPTESLYPLPSNKRLEDMVIWHKSPYKLDGGQDNGEERTGCDYLLPYWMGVYYGYVNEEW